MFKYLTLEAAEKHVSSTPNTWWEGWTMQIFTPRPRAEFDRNGRYHNGTFGYIYNVRPDSNGRYKVKK